MLKAAATIEDITPEGSVYLAGYPHVARMSEGVHDPLLATFLYLESEGRAVVVGSLDLLFLSPDSARRLREVSAEAAETAPEAVLIGCTHTHSGPLTVSSLALRDDPTVPPPDVEYLTRLEAAVATAVRRARRLATPARIAWTTARADGIGGNRLSPDGPTDPEVGLLVVRRAGASDLIAVTAVYGMHPTVLHEDNRLVSADFPAAFREDLQRRLGRVFPILYLTGPAGNQSPRRFVKAQTFAEAERLGSALASVCEQAVRKQPDSAFADRVALRALLSEVETVPRRFPSLREAEARLAQTRRRHEQLRSAGAPRAETRTAECALFGAEELVTLARAAETGEAARLQAQYARAAVQAMRIHDRCLAGFPAEIFCEYGLQLKAACAAPVHPVSLVNGESQGYIVTPDAAAAGGYEADSALLAPETGARFVARLRELVTALFGDEGRFASVEARADVS